MCQAGAKQLVFTDQNDGGDSGGNLASVTQTGMVNGRHTSRRKWTGSKISPVDGAFVYTRVGDNQNATLALCGIELSDNNQENLLFADSSMPDWE